jgi:hypothetical protein
MGEKRERESDPTYMKFLHEWAESRHSRSYPKRIGTESPTESFVTEKPRKGFTINNLTSYDKNSRARQSRTHTA